MVAVKIKFQSTAPSLRDPPSRLRLKCSRTNARESRVVELHFLTRVDHSGVGGLNCVSAGEAAHMMKYSSNVDTRTGRLRVAGRTGCRETAFAASTPGTVLDMLQDVICIAGPWWCVEMYCRSWCASTIDANILKERLAQGKYGDPPPFPHVTSLRRHSTSP